MQGQTCSRATKTYHSATLPEFCKLGYRCVTDEILFDAVLRPNQSLGKKGLLLMLGLVTLLFAVGGTLFFYAGAWPVTGFLGLDLALLFVALRLSYRSGFLTETVQLRPATLTVSRYSPGGDQMAWCFHPYWLDVEFNQEEQQNSQVLLCSKGERLSVGSFLSSEERAEFAVALRTALQRCKSLTRHSKH